MFTDVRSRWLDMKRHVLRVIELFVFLGKISCKSLRDLWKIRLMQLLFISDSGDSSLICLFIYARDNLAFIHHTSFFHRCYRFLWLKLNKGCFYRLSFWSYFIQCYNKVFLPFELPFNQDPIVFNKKEDSEGRCTERGKWWFGSRSSESIKIKRVMNNQSPLDKWQIIRKTIRQLSLSRFETRPRVGEVERGDSVRQC